jgi:penicillin G amidase
MRVNRRLTIKFSGSAAGAVLLIVLLSIPLGDFPALGGLLNPVGGVWNGAFAEYPAMKTVSGSGHSGTVYRDSLGIPHIFAGTFNDLSYIMGYLQATDRMFSMDIERKLIAGKLSEIMGPSFLESDKFMRVMGFARSGQDLWNKIVQDNATDPELQLITKALQAYCDGVNRYIDEVSPLHLPFEYMYLGFTPEHWTVHDVMSLIKYQTYSLGFDSADLLMTIIKDKMGIAVANELRPLEPYSFEEVVIPDFYNNTSGGTPKSVAMVTGGHTKTNEIASSAFGSRGADDLASLLALFQDSNKIGPRDTIVRACSNNWVVNGSLSYSGYPILCNDPHLPLMLPPVWWEFQFVNSSNPADCIYGVSFPGTPIAEIGHTTRIAWGCTVTAYDQNDFYAEKFNADGTQYLFNKNQWRNVETTTETIKVKGQSDVNLAVKFTRHDLNPEDNFPCPVITDSSIFGSKFSGFTNIALKWTGFAADYGILKGFYRLNRAKNLNDYLDAMRVYSSPGQNFVFADVDGNIALYPKANYPVRNATGTIKTGEFVLNGSNGDDEWTGYIPFEWIPHKINPSQMYLASANQRTVNATEYTKYYTHYAFETSYRGRRINELLRNESTSHALHGTTITIEKMKKFQTDYYDIGAEVFVPFLLAAFNTRYPGGVPATGTTALLNKSITALRAWNASNDRWVMDKDLIAPTVFDTWLSKYVYATIGDEFVAAGITMENQSDWLYAFPDFVENLTRFDQNSHWFDDVSTTSTTEHAQDIMLRAMDQAIVQIQADLGDFLNWEWGNYHHLDIEYLMGAIPAFNYPKYPCSGSARTINVAGGHDVQEGPSMRLIVDMASLGNNSLHSGFLTIMGGQSGNPVSSHYDDNFKLWQSNTYHQILFPRIKDAYPLSEIYSTVLFG